MLCVEVKRLDTHNHEMDHQVEFVVFIYAASNTRVKYADDKGPTW